MKIVCNKNQLLEIINTVQKAVSTKSTMEILECIKIDADARGSVIFTGNNLDLCIEYTGSCEIPQGGSIAISSKMLGEIVRRMPDGNISIEVNYENNVTKIKNGSSEFNIQGLNSNDFPAAPEIEEQVRITLPQATLKRMIKKTIFCVAPETSMPILTGALFEIKDGTFGMVSTDKSRLAIVRENIGEGIADARFVVPGVTLRELLKILKDEETVDMVLADRHVMFEFEGFKIFTRLLDGEFINYSPILGMGSSINATVSTREICDSLERASLLINDDISAKTRRVPVVLNINFDKIEIHCMTNRGMVHDVVKVDLVGEGLQIGFNNQYLLEALKATEEEKVKMEFRDAESACFIKSIKEDSSYTYVVLPVRPA